MRLHATKLKAVGVPVKGLLDLLGLDVDDLMKMPPGSGIRADGDDLLLDTAALLPPPRTEGRLQTRRRSPATAWRLHDDRAAAPPRAARPRCRCRRRRNYLYFFGGSIRFGKLTMSDADMQLIDADPSTPFDFFPAHYEDQLVAGYSRNTRRKGLQVFMPDYSRVTRERRYPEAAAAAMRVLLLSMPDSFEHTPALTMRMPNGALASLAGNAGPRPSGRRSPI